MPAAIADQDFRAFQDKLKATAEEKLRHVYALREEILTAFIAKYSFEPERARIIEQRQSDGSTHWFVVRATDEQMAEASKIAANL